MVPAKITVPQSRAIDPPGSHFCRWHREALDKRSGSSPFLFFWLADIHCLMYHIIRERYRKRENPPPKKEKLARRREDNKKTRLHPPANPGIATVVSMLRDKNKPQRPSTLDRARTRIRPPTSNDPHETHNRPSAAQEGRNHQHARRRPVGCSTAWHALERNVRFVAKQKKATKTTPPKTTTLAQDEKQPKKTKNEQKKEQKRKIEASAKQKVKIKERLN